MTPFEDRYAKIEAYKRNKKKDKLLETSNVNLKKSDIVSFEVKGKGKGKEEKEKNDFVVKKEMDDDETLVPSTLASKTPDLPDKGLD